MKISRGMIIPLHYRIFKKISKLTIAQDILLS